MEPTTETPTIAIIVSLEGGNTFTDFEVLKDTASLQTFIEDYVGNELLYDPSTELYIDIETYTQTPNRTVQTPDGKELFFSYMDVYETRWVLREPPVTSLEE